VTYGATREELVEEIDELIAENRQLRLELKVARAQLVEQDAAMLLTEFGVNQLLDQLAAIKDQMARFVEDGQ
jgi:regulator of replication initiation timing